MNLFSLPKKKLSKKPIKTIIDVWSALRRQTKYDLPPLEPPADLELPPPIEIAPPRPRVFPLPTPPPSEMPPEPPNEEPPREIPPNPPRPEPAPAPIPAPPPPPIIPFSRATIVKISSCTG
ncbi:hypothetical protein BLOT_013371 [Blomia tropicalis]|nr:hypothetical protein BLOT_013371 [Blomia tropicalis]